MIEIPSDNQQLSSQQTLEMLQFYFETIICEYTAFNHAQIVFPLYQTFLVQLNQQLRILEQSNNGNIIDNCTYQNLKALQKKAQDDLIIQEMLFEYDEFIHPIQIQTVPKILNQKQKLPQKQQKAASCILNENYDKQEFQQTGSKSVLIHQTKDKIQSISEFNENKLNVIKEFDEKSYFSQINFEINPQQDLKVLTEQRVIQSQNFYYNEAQLDDAYYVIQQARMELQDNEILIKWFNETYGEYMNMIQQKINTMQINLNELESDGWIIEKNTKTLVIKYKIDSKNSTVTLFMDSVFEANVTKLMALINEIELYQNYVYQKYYYIIIIFQNKNF